MTVPLLVAATSADKWPAARPDRDAGLGQSICQVAEADVIATPCVCLQAVRARKVYVRIWRRRCPIRRV